MKLLKIELENLNSLYGRHSVDFDKDLHGAPLFLIMGPTGSGKSTLMDAMSLALFGQTPRLTKNKADKDIENDSRQIMSRGTAAAFAQLTFQKTENGNLKKYRATWQCERAYKKPDGNFKDPRRILEYFDLESQTFIEIISDHRPKFYEPYFEKILERLTVDDFKRMILLAQGEFAAFLKANEDERAEILERLTNTEIYKEIGKKAADKKRSLEEKLNAKNTILNGVNLLTETQENEIITQKNEIELQLSLLESKLKIIEQTIAWFEKEEDLEKKVFSAKEKFSEINIQISSYHDKFEKLQQYKKAQKTIAFIHDEEKKTNEIKNLNFKISENKIFLSELVIKNKEIEFILINQKDEINKKKQYYDSKINEILKARSLRFEKERMIKEINTKRETLSVTSKEEKLKQASLTLIEKKIFSVEKERELLLEKVKSDIATCYFEYQSFLPILEKISLEFETSKTKIISEIAPFSHPSEKLNSLEKEKNNINLLKNSVSQLLWKMDSLKEKELKENELKEILKQLKNQYENNVLDISEIEHFLENISKDLLSLKNEISTLTWAMEIAKKRRNLGDCEDCPLCGSKEHPYFIEKSFEAVDKAVLEKYQILQIKLLEKEEYYNTLFSNLKTAEAVQKSIQKEKNQYEQSHLDLKLELKLQKQDIELNAMELLTLDLKGGAHYRAKLEEKEQEYKHKYKQIEKKCISFNETYENYNYLKEKYSDIKEKNQNFLNKYENLKVIINDEHPNFNETEYINYKKHSISKELNYFEKNAYHEDFRKINSELKLLLEDKIKSSVELSNLSSALSLLDDEISALYNSMKHIENELSQYLNGSDPDIFEAQLKLKIEEQATQLKLQENLQYESSEKIAVLRNILENLNNHSLNLDDDIKTLETQIENDLKYLNIEGRKDALLLYISNEEFEHNNKIFNEFERIKISCIENKSQRENDLIFHKAEKPSYSIEKQKEDLFKEKEEALHALSQSRELKSELLAKFMANKENKRKISDIYLEVENIQKEYSTWLKLHHLIGVNDGNQFKKFAQILNLEELIAKANVHLTRFEKRYSLAPAQDSNGIPRLAFAIKDSYHANEIRSFKTLSGGETFLVSLALALALADYRSVKMPVETILLDEGFGTLDPATLQIAMSALESLHSHGTQVGIISHVEALKETIGARVIVEKQGNGHSILRIET